MQISQNEMRIQSWRMSSLGLCMTCTTCNSTNRVCWYINIIIWYSSPTTVLSVINIRADNNFQSIHDSVLSATWSVCSLALCAQCDLVLIGGNHKAQVRPRPQSLDISFEMSQIGWLEWPSTLVWLVVLVRSAHSDDVSLPRTTNMLGFSMGYRSQLALRSVTQCKLIDLFWWSLPSSQNWSMGPFGYAKSLHFIVCMVCLGSCSHHCITLP